MASDRKLRAWHEAGLIDADTLARIGAWEAEHARPLGLWAAIGIGALAIGLGLISVVAANWDEVPGLVRLALHLGLIAALAGFLALRGAAFERDHPWWLEAALFVLALLGMTFFGHIGQVYQTGSPLWQPLAAWLVLFAPVLLLRGQSWLAAALVLGTLVYACWDYAGQFGSLLSRHDETPWLWLSAVTAAPVLVAAPAAAMRGRSVRVIFWKRLEQLALAYGVGGASLLCAAAGIDEFGKEFVSLGSQTVRALIVLGAGLLLVLARPGESGRMAGAILAGAGAAAFLAYPFSGSAAMAGILFMALWVGIAGAALRAGWRMVFQLTVAVVALRLIVLSFELASDLLTSGFGLIAAGLLILAIAGGAVRVSRSLAPPQGGETG